jgi:hypothetical protein
MLASTGAMMIGPEWACRPSSSKPAIFPAGTRPESLFTLKLPAKTDWHQKISLACFQGLINRRHTRIYLDDMAQDRFWLDYYNSESKVPHQIVSNIPELVGRFAAELDGCIVYDPTMPHSINLATTIGALKNAVPVSSEIADAVPWRQFKKIEDLTGKWKNMYEAYEWGLEHLLPACNQKLLAQLCVHHPHWPVSSWTNRDYVIAHNVFSIDISSSERDKKDYQLLRKIYKAYPQGTVVIGWHCVRDKEHESIALSSEYGHYGMCSLRTGNLTVHTSIIPKDQTSYKQRQINKDTLKVRNKVYIAFMSTDGDAAWFVQNHINKDWISPARGKIKYSWGFLPMAYELMPSLVHYYMTNLKETDFFVAGPAGATYTYPHLHPQPEKFLRLSHYYMQKCGLNTVHMTNWNDRDWWQEVDLPNFPALLRKTLPDCAGYVRGMGESAFELNYITDRQPYIFCGEGIHRGDDIQKVMQTFIDACPNRPLFIYALVNHNVPMHEIMAGMANFPSDQVELVHLDELLLLIGKAHQEGKISDELYPDKSVLKKLLAQEARRIWPAFQQELVTSQSDYHDGETAYTDRIRKTTIGLEQIVPADFLTFTTIWQAMNLVKISLESIEVYVNNKPLATSRFLDEFKGYSDFQLIHELQRQWNNWHQLTFTFDEARDSADRLVNLATDLTINHFNK